MEILVTGATGSISGQLLPLLTKSGRKVRAMVHSEAKGEAARAAGAEVVVGDYEDAASLDRAMAGVHTLFLLTPPGPKASTWAAAGIAAAKRAGVGRLVRVSVLKADPGGPTDNVRQHARADALVVESGIAHTILRPNFFMQNLFASAQSMAGEGALYMGMADGKIAMIDVRDIVDVAAKAVLDPRWDGQAYDLCGPASITYYDVARTVSSLLGREVKYVAVPPEAVEAGIRKAGMGDWFATVMRDYSRAYAAGWGDVQNDAVEKISGHPPRSFETFAREVLVPALSRSK